MAALKKSAPKGAEGQGLPPPENWIGVSLAPLAADVNIPNSVARNRSMTAVGRVTEALLRRLEAEAKRAGWKLPKVCTPPELMGDFTYETESDT
jgi:hypothetical protein